MKKLLVVIVIIALCALSELFYLSVKANFYSNKPINWTLLYAIVAALVLLVVMFYSSLYSIAKSKQNGKVGADGKTVSQYQDRLVEMVKKHKSH